MNILTSEGGMFLWGTQSTSSIVKLKWVPKNYDAVIRAWTLIHGQLHRTICSSAPYLFWLMEVCSYYLRVYLLLAIRPRVGRQALGLVLF